MDTLIFISIACLLIFGMIDVRKALYFVLLSICTLILVGSIYSFSYQVLIFIIIIYSISCVVYIMRKWNKSKQFGRLSSEYEELVKTVDSLKESNVTLRKSLETYKETNIKLESYKKQSEDEISNLISIREQNEILEKDLASYKEDNVKLRFQNKRNEKVIKVLQGVREQNKKLEKELDEYKGYKDKLESKQVSSTDIETMKNQYTKVMGLCQSLTEELSTAIVERDTFESQLFDYEDLVDENNMLRVQIFNLNSRIEELLISLTCYKSSSMGVYTNENVKKLISIYKIIIYELERRLSEYDEDKKYKDMYISSNTEMEQLEVQLEDCMLQVQEMQEQYNTLLGAMSDQSNTIKDLEASIKERDTTIEDLSKTIESLNMELKLLKKWR